MNKAKQKRTWLTVLIEEKGYDKRRCALSKEAGIHESYIGKIENGVRNPSVQIAMKLGEVLGFDWTRFFDEKITALPERKEVRL